MTTGANDNEVEGSLKPTDTARVTASDRYRVTTSTEPRGSVNLAGRAKARPESQKKHEPEHADPPPRSATSGV